jgi:molybdopterin synthase catalytic subunit
MISARLEELALDVAAEFGSFVTDVDGDGAVITFAGIARGQTRDGAEVDRLFLDHHPRLTERSLREIAGAAAARFDVTAVKVVHRCGEVAPGETIVFVAASSRHRRAAFEATDYMMDRLKTDAIFWKREDTALGSRWIEPTDTDRAERARWSD